MRLGPLEILIIVAVIIIGALAARFSARGVRRDKAAAPGAAAGTGQARRFISRAGTGLIVAGALLLLAGVLLFRWAMQSYSWAFLVLVAGIVLTLLSRRR